MQMLLQLAILPQCSATQPVSVEISALTKWIADLQNHKQTRQAVQANLQNVSVQCNQQLPEDVHGIAVTRSCETVQQLRREETYKSL